MRAEIAIRPALWADIGPITADLREADRRECLAQTLLEPEDAIAMVMRAAVRAWTGTVNGVPACLFGVSRGALVGADVGTPWLVGTPLIEQYERSFLRRNRDMVREMSTLFPRLENYVDIRNQKSVRWLRWLGFTIHEAEPHGPLGRRFHRFTLEA